jgi:hypothetical protein
VIVHVLILWGVIGAAAALAVVVHRRRTGDEPPEYGSALGFVGAAYGLLLGLLVTFAVGHYNNVRSEAQNEASSLVALYDVVGPYPPETRDHVRHDLVCYMRSIVADDWPSMERGSQLEAPRTLGFGDQLRGDVYTGLANNPAQSSSFGHAATLLSAADASRQRLLFLTEPEIPTALWVLIYVGAFLVFSLLAVHYGSRPTGRHLVFGSSVVLMTVVVGVLATLDQPFSVGVRVQPDQMSHAINLVLVDETNPTIVQACR